MRASGKIVSVVILALSIAACHAKPTELSPAEKRISKIGNDYVAQHYPLWDRTRFPVWIKDGKDRWIFAYKLSDDMLGGTPVVEIHKRDLNVVRAYQEQ